jgi:ACS family hexuronate transporter-like MFS transporter
MRWLVLLMLMFGWGASYLPRVTLSTLAPAVQADLALTSVQLGATFPALAFGLLAGYVLMTLLTFLAGTRWALVAAFTGAALASAASGFVSSLEGLLVARFLLGFFSAGILPAAVQSAREWFPAQLRPLVIGLFLASGQLAVFLIPPAAAVLHRVIAWRAMLVLTGLPTLIAAVLCAVIWKSPPPPEAPRPIPAAAFASPGMLAVGLFLSAPLTLFTLAWLPVYLRDRFHLDLQQLGSVGAATGLAGAFGAALAGIAAWLLMFSEVRPWKARAALLTVSGCLVPLITFAGAVRQWQLAVALMALSCMAYFAWATALYSAVADTLPVRGVALAAALGALLTNVGGALAPAALSYLAQHTGYDVLLRLVGGTAALALPGVLLMAWLIPHQPEEAPVPQA